METLLTFTAEILAIGFAALMIFDFVGGLLHLYHSSAPAATQETEKELEQAIAPQTELAIAQEQQPELEPQPQMVPGWHVIEPIGPSVATLLWIERNMLPTEVFSVEMPDARVVAVARQLQVQQPVTLATKQQLISAGSRKCKKLASSLQIRRYNTMRLAELAAVLEGKVAVSELVA